MCKPQPVAPAGRPPARPLAWHAFDAKSVAAKLGIDPSVGLTHAAARARRERYGQNRPFSHDRKSWTPTACPQLANGRTLTMTAATLAALAMGAYPEALCLAAVETISQGIFLAVSRLRPHRSRPPTRCRVYRDGRLGSVAPVQLVPGDVVFIGPGELIPADLRLTEVRNLIVDETALSGYAMPVKKATLPVASDVDFLQMTSMGWMGTRVLHGEGTGLVVATGAHTKWSQRFKKHGPPPNRAGLHGPVRRGSTRQTMVFLAVGIFAVLLAGWHWRLSWIHRGWCAVTLLAAAGAWQWPLERPVNRHLSRGPKSDSH